MTEDEGLRSGQPREQIDSPPERVVSLAVDASTCSPCRSKRGAAIFSGDSLVSTGFNYKPSAFACDGSDTCKATCRVQAIHAEQQALLLAGRKADGADLLHVKTVGGTLVPSGGPSCVPCSKLILGAGIQYVWLFEALGWRRYDAETFHRLSLAAQVAASVQDGSSGDASRRSGLTDRDPVVLAGDWLRRQRADGSHECVICGALAGEYHEPTDPCGIVGELLDRIKQFEAPRAEASGDRDAVIEECISAVRARRDALEDEEDEELRFAILDAACFRVLLLQSRHAALRARLQQ